MKALPWRLPHKKTRKTRISVKCANQSKNKANLENSNFLNLSQRSGVLTASGWFGGRHTSPRPRSCIRWSSLRSLKNSNIGNTKWGINKQYEKRITWQGIPYFSRDKRGWALHQPEEHHHHLLVYHHHLLVYHHHYVSSYHHFHSNPHHRHYQHYNITIHEYRHKPPVTNWDTWSFEKYYHRAF